MHPEFTLTERELMQKGTPGTVGTVFDPHAAALCARPLAPAGLVDIRADLTDAITTTLQKRPWVWVRHGAGAVAMVLLVLTHAHGWPTPGP